MIRVSHYIRDICDNLAPQGNCVKRDIGQIFGLEHATDDLVNSLQDSICLWVFYSGACWFDRKVFEQWNEIPLELGAIVEDYLGRSRIN